MNYTKDRRMAEEASPERYLTWQQQECCPVCQNDHLFIRLMAPTSTNSNRWKFDCRECNTRWYGPDLVK